MGTIQLFIQANLCKLKNIPKKLATDESAAKRLVNENVLLNNLQIFLHAALHLK